jgi:predicted AAA+ superfamily ATPase
LALFTKVPIVPGKTLIIFDEIQECNGAFNSLKYFCEDAPEYHIIAAGLSSNKKINNHLNKQFRWLLTGF